MPAKVLVVDDDPVQRRLLEGILTRLGHGVELAESGDDAMERLGRPGVDEPGAILLDLVMPGMDGMAVLEALKARGSRIPVIVQTSQGSIDTVITAMRLGAVDFIVKPASPERIEVSLRNALKIDRLEEVVGRLQRTSEGTLSFADILTGSDVMTRVLRLAERAAKSHIPILLEGESGVGKELIARAIQGTSQRRGKAFVTVNCGAIPEKLVESVLFGHEKGAFTGASERHAGKFQQASGGTLFLDEIGELSLDLQVKLLRALQEGEIDPVGARRPVKVDFRLISATNRSLLDLTAKGAFREDLYYRLNVFPIFVPALRERMDDMPVLVDHFITRFAAEEGKRGLRGITPDALTMLMQYGWPGNIRQLENAIFRAVVLSDGAHLRRCDFPQIALAVDGEVPEAPAMAPMAAAPLTPTLQPADTPAPYALSALIGEDGNLRSLVDLEEEAIRFAIAHCNGRMRDVARQLRIGRSTLYRKLRDYGIDAQEPLVAET